MDASQVAEATRDLRLALTATDVPESSIDLIAGAAAGVMMALTSRR
jgi:hypothetical protein